MPLNLFYTMVQKSQKWPKTKIKEGSCLNACLGPLGMAQGSSELNNFPENGMVFFCSNHHLLYADNGPKNNCGIFG